MQLAYHTICWGGVVADPTGVTSIKDLLYRSYGDVAQAAAEIASIGYSGMEIFEGNLLDHEDDPSAVTGMLGDEGLDLVAVYAGGNFIYPDVLDDELARLRRSAAMAAACGATFLVVGGGAQRTGGEQDGDLERLADGLDAVVDIAEEHGLDAVLHPHLTTIVESPPQIAAVLEASRIGLCLDTAHAAAGGGDPAAMVRRHADRLRYVHLKDLRRADTSFTPLGAGDLDVPGIVEALRECGYDGWATVELDSYDGPPAEAAQKSHTLLRTLVPE